MAQGFFRNVQVDLRFEAGVVGPVLFVAGGRLLEPMNMILLIVFGQGVQASILTELLEGEQSGYAVVLEVLASTVMPQVAEEQCLLEAMHMD